ncbi:MAG TPA: hypothetical protein VM077_01435 [Candidatus Limnocylindrales bacterium]|nr:hypothetical protein [Candidatus Limnocylindrales bacterium]
MKDYSLKIGWLYPDLMSTYGDRGNVIVLQKRCEWRDIEVKILKIDEHTNDQDMKTIDILFGGGAQDREQKIVIENLNKKKQILHDLIEKNVPSLFVCGSPQLFGKYYEPEEGKRIEGLGIFDMISKHPGINHPRLIGNVIARAQIHGLEDITIVGFENHGGRTYLGSNARPFAKIIKGNGNNGEDSSEGVIYKNAIGSYFHGPLLPKNPEIADWLISKALDVKYKKSVTLKDPDDTLSRTAKSTIAKRLGIKL